MCKADVDLELGSWLQNVFGMKTSWKFKEDGRSKKTWLANEVKLKKKGGGTMKNQSESLGFRLRKVGGLTLVKVDQ